MPREFVLTHVVDDVSNMKELVHVYSNEEVHFGVLWKMCVRRNNGSFGFYLFCEPPKSTKNWSIETSPNFKLISATGKKLTRNLDHCFSDKDNGPGVGQNAFTNWDDMMKDYVVEDKIIIQIHVKILKMTGIEKKKLRSFDESRKQFSDVVLVVGDEKFHVSKLFLADQSSYFEALFLRNFSESEQSEVKLSDIDSKEFQNFLEVLYGEPAIDDTTVDGVLKLSDMYDAKTAIRKCEEFLIKESDMTLREKLRISTKYKLKNLKTNCLLKIETVDDIKSVMPGNPSELESDVSNILLQKLLALQ